MMLIDKICWGITRCLYYTSSVVPYTKNEKSSPLRLVHFQCANILIRLPRRYIYLVIYSEQIKLNLKHKSCITFYAPHGFLICHFGHFKTPLPAVRW